MRQRALSMLETLPVEVIEQIFLYSLNLNLPRASSTLAAAISREHIYNLLIILACWNDPMNDRPFSAPMAGMLAPLHYVPRTLDERTKLQEAVFRCQWCTMNRVRDQIPKIVNLTLHRLWINGGIEMEPDQRAALDRFMKRQDTTTSVFKGRCSSLDPFRKIASTHFPGSDPFPQTHVQPELELHIQSNVRIEVGGPALGTTIVWPAIELQTFPVHLLRGRSTGFTVEDVAFLDLLRLCSNNFYTGCGLPRSPSPTTVNRMALHQGVRKAIRTQNLEALISLLKIDELTYRFGVSSQGRNAYYTIPSDHFVTVSRVGRNTPQLNLAFFEALIRASAESIPAHSSEITQWTVQNVRLAEQDPAQYGDTNGKFARWLSNFILRLPGHIQYAHDNPGRQLFFCGKLDMLHPEGCRYFEEVVQPRKTPLMNYMAESSFHPEEFWMKPSETLS